MRPVRLLFCLFWLSLGLAAFGHAAEQTPREMLDAAKTVMSEIDDELKLETLNDRELVRLRLRAEPLATQLQTVVSELTPRLEASRKRLVELKPKGPEIARETDPAADELKAEQTVFDQLDADLRTARAGLLQVDDFIARIAARRREIFTTETFARSTSLLSPVLWLAVLKELPADAADFRQATAAAGARLAARQTDSQLLGFAGVIIGLLALAAPLRWMASRVIAPREEVKAPGRLRKALIAVWTLAVLAAIPLLALGVLSYALEAFDISDPRLQGVVKAVLDGLRLIAVANAWARALLAPKRSVWRMVAMGDEVAGRLARLVIAVAVVLSAARIVEAIAESVLSYNLLVLTRGLSSIAIAALTAETFRRLTRSAEAVAAAKDGGRPLRLLAWVYLVAIIVCGLAGYIALSTYLVEHALQFIGAIGVLYLLDALLQEACERVVSPDSIFAQSLMVPLGLRREGLEQIVVLLQGAIRITAIVGGLAVAVGPFGLPSQDLLVTLRTAYFGVSVGGVTLSISSLVAALIVFLVILGATRAAQNWLSERYLPRTRLDAGVKNSVRTIFGYLGVVVALVAAGVRLGVDADRVAWIAGGLSVGIGFGLQAIANNFVSGLILLWERGVRVGDWVVVGQDQGFVRRINARSTEIETFERATLIVPNTMLVTGTVKNWLHHDRVGRLIIAVNAAYESDPEAVRSLLIEAARAQEAVLSIPAPLALFTELADWAMKFQLIVYVEDALMGERVRSELNFDIMHRMRAAGLRIPYPFPIGVEEKERGPNTAKLAGPSA